MKSILALALLILLLLASFRVEGHSYYIGNGESTYFLTMGRCRREAASTYAEGGNRYAGYTCTRQFLWFTLDVEDYYAGKPG